MRAPYMAGPSRPPNLVSHQAASRRELGPSSEQPTPSLLTTRFALALLLAAIFPS